MKKSTVFLITALTIVGLAMSLALCAGLLVLSYYLGEGKLATKNVDERLLITVDDLERHFPCPGDRLLCVERDFWDFPDGAQKLEYDYDAKNDPSVGFPLSFSTDTILNPNLQLAELAMEDQKWAANLLVNLSEGSTLESSTILDDYCDDRYFVFVIGEDGDRLGTILAVRHGTTVIGFQLLGKVIDDRETLIGLIQPKLEAISESGGGAVQ